MTEQEGLKSEGLTPKEVIEGVVKDLEHLEATAAQLAKQQESGASGGAASTSMFKQNQPKVDFKGLCADIAEVKKHAEQALALEKGLEHGPSVRPGQSPIGADGPSEDTSEESSEEGGSAS